MTAMQTAATKRPLIAHIVYRFDVGGLENGLVNLINHLPEDRYRHAIICLTDYTDFANRINRRDVTLHALHKPPGNSVKIHGQFWRLFRQLRPSIVHSRNLGSLESQIAASTAGVPVRIHSEHGREADDPEGKNRKQQWIRRLYSPFVHHYIALSRDLADYLAGPVGIDDRRITQLYNGVDTEKFHRHSNGASALPVFAGQRCFVVGTVGRMQAVKDQATLAKAFVRALELMPEARAGLRLVMVGDGPLRPEVDALLQSAGVADLVWMSGSRNDVPDIMGSFDLFALPSLAEGISNTILEAMACRLPVLATAVGGNPELVVAGQTGTLVPAADVERMAHALLDYYRDPERARREGEAGRERVVEHFSLEAMVNRYSQVYDKWLVKRSGVS